MVVDPEQAIGLADRMRCHGRRGDSSTSCGRRLRPAHAPLWCAQPTRRAAALTRVRSEFQRSLTCRQQRADEENENDNQTRFVQDGSIARLSLGLMPRFLGRRRWRQEPRRKNSLSQSSSEAPRMVSIWSCPTASPRRPPARGPRSRSSGPGRGDGAIDLDGFFGLHPRVGTASALVAVAPPWPSFTRAGRRPDHELHFDRRTTWRAARPA